jgi:hypothetical protein
MSKTSVFARTLYAALLAGMLGACGGGGGGEHIVTITSPTVPTPAGCSGTPIDKIGINVNTPATVQVFGETFDVQQASGQATYVITRAAVPCEYVLTATIKAAGERMIVGFARTTPFLGDGGVEVGSVVVEQGDGQFTNPCVVSVGGPNGPNVRIRFRVTAAKGCGM